MHVVGDFVQVNDKGPIPPKADTPTHAQMGRRTLKKTTNLERVSMRDRSRMGSGNGWSNSNLDNHISTRQDNPHDGSYKISGSYKCTYIYIYTDIRRGLESNCRASLFIAMRHSFTLSFLHTYTNSILCRHFWESSRLSRAKPNQSGLQELTC